MSSVCGSVHDKTDNEPIAGVIVQIKDSKAKTLHYGITNERGEFCLKYNQELHEQTLSFQCFGYSYYSINFKDFKSDLIIKLEPKSIDLKEVIVKAPDIMQRSDTLVYHVTKYAKNQDRNISDVLKRLPGITVEENGEIKYNGEAINKFYIDGADFMDGRYSLATENIKPTDVASVEVMENHQPVHALKGIEFSQQAGLNIKLREDARQRWVAIIDGTLGASPLLYDASLFAMRIAGKWQSMETARIDNTGWNPATHSVQHINDQIFSNSYVNDLWNDYISLSRNTSSIDEKRTRDNFSTLVSTSNSWRIREGKDAKFNLTYESDRLNYITGCETDYFDNNITSYVERNAMQTQKHNMNTQWGLISNLATYYLKDNLSINLDWNSATSIISGTNSLWQKSSTPAFDAKNDMQLIKRLDNRLLTLSSRNKYTYKPHTLAVTTNDNVYQEVTTNEFRSVTEVRYGWFIGKWSLYARGGVDFDFYNLESNLQGIESTYPLACYKDFHLLKAYIAPESSYKSHKWLVSTSVPISYNLYHILNKQQKIGNTNQYVSLSPSVYLWHQINAKIDLVGQLKYTLTPPDATKSVETLFMTDYRNLLFPQNSNGYENSFSITSNLRYRNPINSTFFNLRGIYVWNRLPFMQNQIFIEDYLLNSTSLNNHIAQRFSVSGSFSKGLLSGRMKVGFDIGYAGLWTAALRQDFEIPYVLRTVTAGINIKGYITNSLSLDYQLPYYHNRMNISLEQSNNDVIKQFFTLTWTPIKKWQFSFGGEHYYTHFNTGNISNIVLLDASVRWAVSKNIDIALMSSNLLNHREYRYVNYGILSQTTNTFKLRGRNIVVNIQIRI